MPARAIEGDIDRRRAGPSMPSRHPRRATSQVARPGHAVAGHAATSGVRHVGIPPVACDSDPAGGRLVVVGDRAVQHRQVAVGAEPVVDVALASGAPPNASDTTAVPLRVNAKPNGVIAGRSRQSGAPARRAS